MIRREDANKSEAHGGGGGVGFELKIYWYLLANPLESVPERMSPAGPIGLPPHPFIDPKLVDLNDDGSTVRTEGRLGGFEELMDEIPHLLPV